MVMIRTISVRPSPVKLSTTVVGSFYANFRAMSKGWLSGTDVTGK